ncbi:cytochrome b [Microbulbifer zhoushanensis]|uniref:cytochrome b n=1 Tax=Microbulbifer zhoushanensis TaxID=2904254 RepID=UPI001F25312B|nr:cytochrome b [Microbulbifer zhoushanensis]
MTVLKNTPQRYGTVAIALHWLMAVLLIGLVALGLYMSGLPDVGFDKRKIGLVLLHKEYGMVALGLAAVRLAWRLGNVLPALAAQFPDWQKVAARFVHLCFYALMFALPVTGWLMSSAAAIPVYAFGVRLPDLIAQNEYRFQVLIEVHKWLGYALIGFIVIHAGAALRHHFLSRDNTLKKMLPGAGNQA